MHDLAEVAMETFAVRSIANLLLDTLLNLCSPQWLDAPETLRLALLHDRTGVLTSNLPGEDRMCGGQAQQA